jgi:hypothetical protein
VFSKESKISLDATAEWTALCAWNFHTSDTLKRIDTCCVRGRTNQKPNDDRGEERFQSDYTLLR